MELDDRHNVELIVQRLVYDLLADDLDAYRLTVDEMDDCTQCLRAALYTVTRHWAGMLALQSGGRDKAAEELLKQLGRVLMP